MNWLANICPTAERKLVDYVRQAQIPGIPSNQIYAGMSHGSQDNPSDPATAEDAFSHMNGVTVDSNEIPHNDETLKTPRVLIVCDSAEANEGFPDGNVMEVSARVEFLSHSDDMSGQTHAAIAGRLFDLFCDHQFADRCSESSEDFTIIGRAIKWSGYNREGHCWVSHLNIKMNCCGANI